MTKTDFLPAITHYIVSCPVCKSKKFNLLYKAQDYEYELPGTFIVSECSHCGLVIQNPRPKFSEILRYYTEKYEPFKTVGSIFMQKLRYQFLVVSRINKYLNLFKNSTDKIKLLDVGCAAGDLLSELSKNSRFICEGVEPVNYAVKIAKNRGLKVHHTTLEKFKCKNDSYDLIIMNHVVEHLPNPEDVIKKTYQILKKGGYFSGELPCADSIERMVFGKYWNGYHLPRHLTFFSKSLLINFFKNIGFSEVDISLQPAPSSWQASLRNIMHDKKISKNISRNFSGHSLILNLISFPCSFITSKIGFSTIMHFTARK